MPDYESVNIIAETRCSANKRGSKPRQHPNGPTHLYRHFTHSGQLLYVGVSLNAVSRLMQHREYAQWFNQIATIRVDVYPTRAEALAAEKRLIQKFQPRYNVMHTESNTPLAKIRRRIREAEART